MSEFDLRAVARKIVAEDTSEDFAQIVKQVRHAIPGDHTEEALDQALPAFVHQVIRSGFAPAPEGPQPPAAGKAARRGSAKVRAIRAAWQRYLDSERYTVGDGSVRRVGDMSAEDVTFVAGKLEALAAQNAAQAGVFRALELAMGEHGAARVRDLPADVLGGVLG